MLGRDQNLDAARYAGLAADEACAFKGKDHLVNGRRGNPEVPLHLPFGGRSPMQACVEIDKGEILALLGRKSFCRATHASHPIQLFAGASTGGGTDECTLSGRTEPIYLGCWGFLSKTGNLMQHARASWNSNPRLKEALLSVLSARGFRFVCSTPVAHLSCHVIPARYCARVH